MPVIRFTVGGDYDPLSYLIADNAASGITLVQPSGVNFSISSNTPSAPVIASGVVLASSVDDGLYLDFSDSSDPLFATGGDRGDVFVGGAGNDQLTGGAGNDVLTGGLGNDLLNGGDGIDTVRYDDQATAVTVNLSTTTAQATGRGNDTILDVENVIGSSGNDTITGNAANNVLDGGLGNDTLNGGDGDDILKVGYGTMGRDTAHGDAGSDTVMITGPSDSDLFFITQSGTHVSFAKGGVTFLDAYDIETYDFTLPGGSTLGVNTMTSGTLNLAIGAGGSQVTTATVAASVVTNITDGAGSDRISTGAGTDNLFYDQGGGDVIANFSAADVTANGLTVAANTVHDDYGFTDVINTSAGAVESITTGAGDDIVYGGAVAMQITTGAGDDIVHGGSSYDTIRTGAGNDTVFFSAPSSTVLTGDGDDTIVMQMNATPGGTYVDAGSGTDTLRMTLDGGYYIFSGDTGGFQSVLTGQSFLGMENVYVTLSGGAELLAILTSGTLNVSIAAGGGTIDMSHADSATIANITDGAGIDQIRVGEGTDNLIYSSGGGDVIANFSASAVTVGGTTVAANAVRDEYGFTDLIDTSVGRVESVTTGAGNDAIYGGANAMRIATGDGDDSITIQASALNGSVIDGGAGNDSVHMALDANDYYLVGTASESEIDGFNSGTAVAHFTGVETLYVTVAGGRLSNFLTDGTAALYAAAGGSMLDASSAGAASYTVFIGGAGNDSFAAGDGYDRIKETGGDVVANFRGNDFLEPVGLAVANTIRSSFGGTDTLTNAGTFNEIQTGTGNDYIIAHDRAMTIRTGAGNDTVLTGAGIDIVYGGAGDDIVYVSNAADKVYENDGDGTDTVHAYVSFSLAGQYIENLVLEGTGNGTGNSLDNSITGSFMDNVLRGMAGNDTLDGGEDGLDQLYGGLGDDTYHIDHLGETAYEIADEGYDTVVSSVSYNLTGQYIEALTLTGNAAISGTGNSLENVLTGNGAANVLRGLAGNDSITGNGGADKMYGGTGDDSYYVDNATQHVYENADEGYDTVFASVTFSLAGQYVEELHLTGDAAINGTGNSLNNVLYGNDADNRLVGGAGDDNLHGGFGNDTLYGGAGADHYWFDTTPGEGNVDFLADFNAGEDSIYLDLSVFSGIEGTGTLSADQFHLGAAAQTADERIVYDNATGNIWYDADGSGDGAAVLFATVKAGTALGADNFHLAAPLP